MAVCYLETFVLQNAFVDAGLLYLAALWRGGPVRHVRILLGALLGTAFAVLAAATGGLLRSAPALLAVSAGMALVAFGCPARAETLKSAGALWLFAAVLGGIAALGVPVAAAGAATGAAGVALLRRKNAPPPPRVTLTVRQGAITRTFDAIVDTGNRALDPLTSLPAVLVPGGPFQAREGRVLCVRTAAGASLLPCFLPDFLSIDGRPVRAVAAVAPPGMLDGALVPWALCAERMAS